MPKVEHEKVKHTYDASALHKLDMQWQLYKELLVGFLLPAVPVLET